VKRQLLCVFSCGTPGLRPNPSALPPPTPYPPQVGATPVYSQRYDKSLPRRERLKVAYVHLTPPTGAKPQRRKKQKQQHRHSGRHGKHGAAEGDDDTAEEQPQPQQEEEEAAVAGDRTEGDAAAAGFDGELDAVAGVEAPAAVGPDAGVAGSIPGGDGASPGAADPASASKSHSRSSGAATDSIGRDGSGIGDPAAPTDADAIVMPFGTFGLPAPTDGDGHGAGGVTDAEAGAVDAAAEEGSSGVGDDNAAAAANDDAMPPGGEGGDDAALASPAAASDGNSSGSIGSDLLEEEDAGGNAGDEEDEEAAPTPLAEQHLFEEDGSDDGRSVTDSLSEAAELADEVDDEDAVGAATEGRGSGGGCCARFRRGKSLHPHGAETQQEGAAAADATDPYTLPAAPDGPPPPLGSDAHTRLTDLALWYCIRSEAGSLRFMPE
jgi:hypothetical protein